MEKGPVRVGEPRKHVNIQRSPPPQSRDPSSIKSGKNARSEEAAPSQTQTLQESTQRVEGIQRVKQGMNSLGGITER